jgi:methyl-accepting chemotaxis protein
MERSVKQVANSAELAASAATNASETAAKGGDSAKEAVEKNNKIYNVIQETAEIIRHLGERSTHIDEIVDVITDIADQTNLLALNAAIEAARAGEAGSGFAVVADEVRKLAEGSAEAAEEIATLIRQTQEDTRTAVKSIELGAKEVTEGKGVITRTGQSLDEIVDVLRSSSDMARRISAATKELSRGMKNVTGSIDEISASAEKNASATQETAASMEQMTSSMEDVASSAQKLSDMAIQLREHVGRFNVGAEEREDVTVNP